MGLYCLIGDEEPLNFVPIEDMAGARICLATAILIRRCLGTIEEGEALTIETAEGLIVWHGHLAEV